MKRLSNEIIHFFQNQGCVVVSTIDENGFPHSSCKGIIKISSNGRIYLLDLYKAKTLQNLHKNSRVSITAMDEHRFIGYCLKGRAYIITEDKITPALMKSWEDRITSRLTRRLIKNIREEKGHLRHPEILLPEPEYMIAVKVEEIVDLTPHHLK
jgi:predicted pyridoxine 5'-phosphate oxidase superfamily flavin-nucleotide-binding protein